MRPSARESGTGSEFESCVMEPLRKDHALILTLYRRYGDDAEFCFVDARIGAREAHEEPPRVDKFWGQSDFEIGIILDPDAKGRLLVSLLEERFRDCPDAAEALEAFLRTQEIDFEWRSWPCRTERRLSRRRAA